MRKFRIRGEEGDQVYAEHLFMRKQDALIVFQVSRGLKFSPQRRHHVTEDPGTGESSWMTYVPKEQKGLGQVSRSEIPDPSVWAEVYRYLKGKAELQSEDDAMKRSAATSEVHQQLRDLGSQ